MRILDKYEIVRRLAIGGMGEIFLARQTEPGIDRFVILKTLLPELAKDKTFIAAFLDEARIAASLSHAAIVSIYDVAEWKGIYFIAMEFIEGETVGGLLNGFASAGVVPSPEFAAFVILQAARGLGYAHSAQDASGRCLQVVHRDISPDNIMVRVDGSVKLLDFGIAIATNRANRTVTGAIKGKIRYMSAEQLRGRKVDARSDQFSLGMVFWELLTLSRFFGHGESEVEVLRALVTQPIPPPSSQNGRVSAELDRIVLRMMNPDPNKRYADCGKVADELSHYLGSEAPQFGVSDVARYVKSARGPTEPGRTLSSRDSVDVLELLATQVDGHVPRERRRPPRSVLVMTAILALALVALALVVGLGRMGPGQNEEETPPVAVAVLPSVPPEASTGEPAAPKVTGSGSVVQERVPEPKVRKRPTKNRPKSSKRSRLVGAKRAHPASPQKTEVGYLTLQTQPWTQVWINGVRRGSTPLYRVELKPGEHELWLKNGPYGIAKKQKIRIRSGATRKLDLVLKETKD